MLPMIVRQVASQMCLDASGVREDKDGAVWLDDFVIMNEGDSLRVYREDIIPGGADLTPVSKPISTARLGYGTSAAIALLRAWVNQSLDMAELAAGTAEE